MIAHQTVSEDGDIKHAGVIPQFIKKHLMTVFIRKNMHSSVAAIHNIDNRHSHILHEVVRPFFLSIIKKSIGIVEQEE